MKLHRILEKAAVKASPTVLWCYKKDLGFGRCVTCSMHAGASYLTDVDQLLCITDVSNLYRFCLWLFSVGGMILVIQLLLLPTCTLPRKSLLAGLSPYVLSVVDFAIIEVACSTVGLITFIGQSLCQ